MHAHGAITTVGQTVVFLLVLSAGAFGQEPPARDRDVTITITSPNGGEVWTAGTYQTITWTPTGGWQMHQAIGIRDALRAYTVGGAYAAGDADSLGRIAPGMLADFAVLSDDPLRIPRERLLDLRVVATVCDGKVVYAST